MNLLDWIFITIIGASSIYGLFKGLIKEVISILAVIVGLIGASRIYKTISPIFKGFGLSEQVASILSFFLLFIVFFIIIILIGKLTHRFVHTIFLGWLNRLAGVGFGFIRGVLTSSIIIIVLTITLSEETPMLAQSKLTPHIMNISKVLLSLVPEDLQKRFMEQEKKLREFWEKKLKPQKLQAYYKSPSPASAGEGGRSCRLHSAKFIRIPYDHRKTLSCLHMGHEKLET